MTRMRQALNYIVADDFTGANDIGIGLVYSGNKVSVILQPDERLLNPSANQSYILCTDSRDDHFSVAQSKIHKMKADFPQLTQQKILLKKVDSTLRGNIGAEIEALASNDFPLVIVAIGAPSVGRKTLQGICYVDELPLIETEFASDPKSPISSSRISDILASQTNWPFKNIYLNDIRSSQLSEIFMMHHQFKPRIVICDVESVQDLDLIYNAALSSPCQVLLVSTGDMTRVVSPLAELSSDISIPKLIKTNIPMLGIVGSMSEVSVQQQKRLEESDSTHVIDVDVEALLSLNREQYCSMIAKQAAQFLAAGQHCFLRTCRDVEQRQQLINIANRLGLSRQELGNKVKLSLAELTQNIITQQKPGALFLCGGDIALAICHQLNISEFTIQGITAECVPWGYLSYPQLTSIPVFTKAGGFGDSTTLLQVIHFIEKRI